MYCPHCGCQVDNGAKFCTKCGTQLITTQISNNYRVNNNLFEVKTPIFNEQATKPNNKKMLICGVIIGLVFILIIFSIVNNNQNYYFGDGNEENSPSGEVTQGTKPKKGKYSTVIIYDNKYSGVKISKDEDATKLIEEDSLSQKKDCPNDIKKVEDEIISKYGITAVNLCEMDVTFARELGNVFKKIYEEYPTVRGYLTNLTLVNGSISNNYIAAFMPIFNFATADTSTTYPWVIKTQILLNTSYFLNQERLDASVKDGSNSGHFPPNATIYSPVAHEMGHYLSFLAMMKHYDLDSLLLIDSKNVQTLYKVYDDFVVGEYSLEIIKEAFQRYQKDTSSNVTMDDWRGTISQYALAKDNSGEYIYDETIAEAFHDTYLNGEKATDASKYVVSVLKEKLEG